MLKLFRLHFPELRLWKIKKKNKKVLESTDDLVYSCVGLYPKNVEHLVLETGLEIRKLMRVLVSLELQGYIKEVSKNYYIRR